MIYGGIAKRDLICSLLGDISEFLNTDCMFCVTDTRQFIAYVPGRGVDIHVKIGDAVPPQSPLALAASTSRQATKTMPREVWGIPFRSTATPIFDDFGRVVGCVGIGMSIDREEKLAVTYQNFAKLLGEITEQTTGVSGGITNIAKDSEAFTSVIEKALINARKTQSMIGQINAIAGTTDILALNASVEAARAGAHGKGFAVVAAEIKRLSADTRRLTAEISDMLRQIQTGVERLADINASNSAIVREQVATIVDVQATVSHMQITADDYSSLVK